MIVDAHAHVWSDDEETYPFAPLLAHVPPPQRPAPVETLIGEMDAAGVDKVILVQPSVYGYDNRYLMGCLARWPDRFIGHCLVDPRSPTPQADLLQWCRPAGCSGLRLNTIRQGDLSWLAEADRRPLFQALMELRLPVSFHMDIEQAPVVAQLATRHPTVAFIVDYLGADIHVRHDAAAYLDVLASCPNVNFKLLCTAEDARTPYPFPDIVPFYQAVLARFGAERTMFGSDYPGAATVCGYGDLVEWGKNFPGLGADEREKLMGKTALSLHPTG
ncbi:L-fuconolactonase [Rhodoligotrophos appendicifer]|uniref:amidohydrolase family protein n=1 Tax=Rhodoligotrophos appendicifer TaxID=987056 RepID=UPI00118656D9|nr:amidohydrolase family protein [Rhodoligotrophos appendicifer]